MEPRLRLPEKVKRGVGEEGIIKPEGWLESVVRGSSEKGS